MIDTPIYLRARRLLVGLRPTLVATLRSLDAGHLSEEQQLIVSQLRKFVEKEVVPVAMELEHKDEYPVDLIEQLKGLQLFGMVIPPEYGGLGLPFTTYAFVIEELSRGWMSLGGVLNTHVMVSWMIDAYGSEEQKAALAAGDGHRRASRWPLHDRTRRRQRRAGHQDRRPPRRRPLSGQGPEDVRQQRHPRQALRHAGQDRPAGETGPTRA